LNRSSRYTLIESYATGCKRNAPVPNSPGNCVGEPVIGYR
jgi:hypothetical protein